MEHNIDLNCDMGESFGRYSLGNDEAILPWVSSINVACGFHAGDPVVMNQTVYLAKKYKVAIGAHPGYPDLVGFGRRPMELTKEELLTGLQYQISALKGFAQIHGVKLHHVKPHGALYNRAAKEEKISEIIAEAIAQIDEKLIFVGLAGSAMEDAALRKGLSFAREVFADRGHCEDGSLSPRNMQGGVIQDKELILQRVLEMVIKGTVDTFEGKKIPIKADTICIHGDTPGAEIFAKEMFLKLKANDIKVCRIKSEEN